MHDDPRLFPHLPEKSLTPDGELLLIPLRDTEWETCWEYVLTHDLTDSERSAFWHGASLVYEAMKQAAEAKP